MSDDKHQQDLATQIEKNYEVWSLQHGNPRGQNRL